MAQTLPSVALVGVSGYGRTHLLHLAALAAAGHCRIDAVVAPRGTPAADLANVPAGVRCCEDFAMWCTTGIAGCDLCVLPTPIHLHARMALPVLAAGRSVLVEKPLAASWEELRDLVAARPAAGRFLAVGFHDFYHDYVHDLKRDLVAGRYGRLRRIRVLGLWPRPDAYYARNAWAGRLRVADGPVLDSPLHNAFAHYLMLALFLAGKTAADAAVPVAGEAELYRFRRIESFDTAAVRLRTERDVEIVAAVSHSGAVEEAPRLAVETDDAVVEWRIGVEQTIAPAGGPPVVTPIPDAAAARERMYLQLFQRIAGGAGPICPPRLAAVHAACILDLAAGVPIAGPAKAGRPAPAEIDAACRRVYAKGRLPGESGAAWARRAVPFSMDTSARLARQFPSGPSATAGV